MPVCPSNEELSSYVGGHCAADAARRIENHLSDCSQCIERCISIDHEDELVSDVRQVLDDEASSRASSSASSSGVTPQPESAADVEGEVDGFRIQKELGRGGMGAVYLAEQLSTKRLVALKVLLQGPFASDVAKKRFEREVELAALLDHPNIVTVLESGLSRGRHYFAMKYVEGLELDLFVSDRGLNVREKLELFASISRAISYAHQRGILHRDLKPSNILVDDSGQPHVLDFGLAKVNDPELDRNRSDRLLSTPGQPIGTLPYMSPEQTTGMQHELDVRSDVYSLGLVLFRLLTDHPPYRVTGDVYDVLRNINEVEPKRPSAVRRGLDDEIDTIVLKTLAKDRDRRYQSADALAEDVERYLTGRPILAKRDSTAYVLKKLIGRHRPAVAAGALIVVLLSVALAATLVGRAANIRAETGTLMAALVDDPASAKRHVAEASRSVLQHAAGMVGTLTTSPAYTDRITGARGGLLLDAEAFWRSVDGGLLWEHGEWLELCDAPELASPELIGNLVATANQGSQKQQYIAFCLLGCLADHGDAAIGAACANAATSTNHAGVAAAAAWAARQLGSKAPLQNANAAFQDELTGLTFVRLPASDGFRRGSDSTDRYRYDDEDRSSKAASIGSIHVATTEVFGTLYDRFLDANVLETAYRQKWREQAAASGRAFDDEQRLGLPAGMVSLDHAQRFCEWLSERGNSVDPPRSYRLPTEDEWEYAARAGSTKRFCFGDDPKYAAYFANCDGPPSGHTAAQRMPNWYGLFDMHGGLWEWTGSTYPPELAAAQGLQGQDLYVYRGGAYYSPSVRCRSAQRNFGVADAAYDYTGIRLIMEIATP